MTDTITSQNIVLFSWDNLYIFPLSVSLPVGKQTTVEVLTHVNLQIGHV
jgi:hypothetical protein